MPSSRGHVLSLKFFFFPLLLLLLSRFSRVQLFATLLTVCSLPGSSVYGDSPGKNIGVSCHAFLQGIFPTKGLNPRLPHCRQILYHLSHQGIPEQTLWLVKTNLGTTALESKIQWDWGRELKNLHF